MELGALEDALERAEAVPLKAAKCAMLRSIEVWIQLCQVLLTARGSFKKKRNYERRTPF